MPFPSKPRAPEPQPQPNEPNESFLSRATNVAAHVLFGKRASTESNEMEPQEQNGESLLTVQEEKYAGDSFTAPLNAGALQERETHATDMVDDIATDTLPTHSPQWMAKQFTATERLRRLAKGTQSRTKTRVQDDVMIMHYSSTESRSPFPYAVGSMTEVSASKRSRSGKVNKQSSRKRRKVARPVIGWEALGLVMEYAALSDLQALTSTCKTLRRKLTMTVVVQTAMATAGKDQLRMMEAIERNLDDRAIYMPAPLRVLQLVNAKRCEFCNMACGKLHAIAEFVGLFCCVDCLENCMANEIQVGCSGLWTDSLLHPFEKSKRLRFNLSITSYEDDPLHETAHFEFLKEFRSGGTRDGPIATREHFIQILKLLGDSPSEPFHEIVNEVLQYDPSSSPHYHEFMEARRAVEARIRRAAELARQAVANARRAEAKRLEARRRAAENRYHSLQQVLCDLDQKLRVRIRGFILLYSVDHQRNVTFECPLVNGVLKKFVRAPTKASGKDIRAAAEALNGKFKTLVDLDFLKAPFLSADDPFEKRLQAVFRDTFPDLASIAPNLTEKVFDLICKGELVSAMKMLADFDYDKEAFGAEMLDHLVEDCGLPAEFGPKLAGALWVKCYKSSGKLPQLAFEQACQKFDRISKQCHWFLTWAKAREASTEKFIEYCSTFMFTPSRLTLIERGKFNVVVNDLDYCFKRSNRHRTGN